MSNYFSELKGFGDYKESTLNLDIQAGLIEYFRWGLLEKGAYRNVSFGESAINGIDASKLALSSSAKHFNSGQVWEGFHKNWLWESGITYSPNPLVGTDHANPGISGVYVDGDFYPNNVTGTYAHSINYQKGRVVFDTAIPTGSTVQVAHSYHEIEVTYAAAIPWLRRLQTNAFQPVSDFQELEEGDWDIPPESRVQLPAIAIEVVPRRRFAGFQLGGGQWVYTDVLFHCLATDKMTRDKLVDIVSLQNDKTIHLIDQNTAINSGDYPLDVITGAPVSGALRYPDLVAQHDGGKLRLTQTSVQSMDSYSSNVWGGIVRFTTEGIKLNI